MFTVKRKFIKSTNKSPCVGETFFKIFDVNEYALTDWMQLKEYNEWKRNTIKEEWLCDKLNK